MEERSTRIILQSNGIWTVEDLANYLEIEPNILQQRLSDYGIHTMALSNRYKHKLLKLEDIAAKIGTGKHEVEI